MTNDHTARLDTVAHFDHQVTGVSVAEDDRIFVNFPRWSEDAPLSVAELLPDGSLRPYPDDTWNAWRNARRNELDPATHWVCVQSVVADWRGYLWVIDPAAPAQAQVIPEGPKLVCIDLATDQVARTYAFGEDIAPQGSYLNDVRVSPDGRFAYITDSGARGAIVVVELDSGKAWRALDGHPSTQLDPSVVVKADGRPLRQTDGRGVTFSSDGIAMSRDGQWLYWQAVTGKTLYRAPTAALQDPGGDVAGRVQTVGENGPADGLWFDAEGRLYVSAVEDHAVKVREGDTLRTLVQDPSLIWPDTFSEGSDGTIYVTDSRIPQMSWFEPSSPIALPTRLLKIVR